MVWPMVTAGMMGHLPSFSASKPRGIFAAMVVKERRLIIMPSWRVVAPFSVMYRGRIGWAVSEARKRVMDVTVRR